MFVRKARPLAAALFAGLLLGTLPAAPALAQKKEAKAPQMKLSKGVQAALAEAQKAQQAGDFQGSLAFIAQANAVENKTPDDNYVIGLLTINAGATLKDNKLIKTGIDQALASGKTSAEQQATFVKTLGSIAIQANDYATAMSEFERYLQLNPNDADVIAEMAELYRRQKQNDKAVQMLMRAIEVKEKNTGAKADEGWYRRAVAIAYESNLTAQMPAVSIALVKAYPNPTNWRDILLIFRETNKLDDQTNLDALRLQMAAGALSGERDYYEYADLASSRGLPGEAKKVIDAGIAAGALNPSKQVVKELNTAVSGRIASDKASLSAAEKEARAAANGRSALGTGDAFYGYAMYDKAIEMFRLALQKGGIDAAVANTRLGMSYAKVKDVPNADIAFDSVTTQPRATLAKYWKTWTDMNAAK
jgi:tetratricopeptide (TPR) repeat protein